MKIINKEVSRPISLQGCIQILEKLDIDYSKLNINEIFQKAERISSEQSIKCDETFIQLI